VLSIWLVSPIARSSVSLMPLGPWDCDSQDDLPLFEDGMKQILWSPESAAVNVKRPDEAPFWEITRWSLSKTSCFHELPLVICWAFYQFADLIESVSLEAVMGVDVCCLFGSCMGEGEETYIY
jgi:hypothetical protein